MARAPGTQLAVPLRGTRAVGPGVPMQSPMANFWQISACTTMGGGGGGGGGGGVTVINGNPAKTTCAK